MGHRANNREAMGQPCQARQVLDNMDAGNAGMDWLKFTPHLNRRQRLHVEGIELAGAAVQKEQDTRSRSWGSARRRIGLQELRQRQTAKTESAHLQHLPAREQKMSHV